MGYCKTLRPMRKQLLEELWRMMASKSPQHFFTIYLAIFMLLHEISSITRDRRRWAVDNNIQTANGLVKEHYYSLPEQVEAIQEGANIILSHWHYYKRGFNPLKTDWKKAKGKKTVWAELTEDEIAHLVQICRSYRDPAPIDPDGDHYWTSQMFEENWRPKKSNEILQLNTRLNSLPAGINYV
ncbi:hypothetical protein SLS62_007874 [Diatrype stigma]|uniref:Uncharacterized protein n=1 Tax=Diatrype stigma TaxID=117547 RepID=A0AAN9YQC7_9PEZI